MRQEFDAVQLKARKKRTILSALIIFILIPLTIFVGIVFLDDQRYLLVSLFIVLYTMIPFFLVYEKRKPKAREIVTIAIMSALVVFFNMITYMMTPFQPGTALVIITGIAFGPEAGFLTGALARLILNVFMQQGPWTPWQMFCWGLLGFLAGLIFNKVDLNKLKSRNFQIVQGPVLSMGVSLLVALAGHQLEGGFPEGGLRLWLLIGALVCLLLLLGYTAFMAIRQREWQGLAGFLLCLAAAAGLAWIAHLTGYTDTFLGWKLYAFGALGLLIGLLIQRKRLPVDDLTLALFGFLTVFVIYGGIMNIATMVMASALPAANISISAESLAILYISGAPYDAVHALGTALFLFVFGDMMIRKLERIKIKYGFYR